MDVNLLAVLVAAIVAVVISAVWYMPALFGKAWAAGIGKSLEQVQKDFSPKSIVGAFVLYLLAAYVLARVIGWSGYPGAGGGACVGVIAAIGFSVALDWSNALFEKRNSKLYWIYLLHAIVLLGVMGAILGAWR